MFKVCEIADYFSDLPILRRSKARPPKDRASSPADAPASGTLKPGSSISCWYLPALAVVALRTNTATAAIIPKTGGITGNLFFILFELSQNDENTPNELATFEVGQ
ncbi:MAG: hypothetical protein NTV72_03275 [Candidatus Taylorbacteria bacterium]|nr:hypothetical protein [Candidatus Taylorbacteria bacterium]